MRHTYALVIPALNEAENIGALLARIPRGVFSQIIVVDNGSTDATAFVAVSTGAQVVCERRRGYGQACSTGIESANPTVSAIAFMDADLSDDPDDLATLVRCFDNDEWDMVLGSRVISKSEPGSLTLIQRFGNWLSTRLIAMAWHVQFTDLGPMRILRRDALKRLGLRDRTFGWNVEMQVRAAQLGLRVCELPVRYRKRMQGRSKISGTITGSFCAGTKILWTILSCWILSPVSPAEDSS